MQTRSALFVLFCVFSLILFVWAQTEEPLSEYNSPTLLDVQQEQAHHAHSQQLLQILEQLKEHVREEKSSFLENLRTSELMMRKLHALWLARKNELEIVDWMRVTGFRLMNSLQFILTKALTNPVEIGKSPKDAVQSCAALGYNPSGYYFMNPLGKHPFMTYCDTRGGEGWTIVGKLGANTVADSEMDMDVDVGLLGERQEIESDMWSHVSLEQWEAVSKWTIRIDVDVHGDGSLLQTAYYRPKSDVNVPLVEAGRSWRGSAIYGTLECAFQEWRPADERRTPLQSLVWLDVPEYYESHVDNIPEHLFTFFYPDGSNKCVTDEGESNMCKKPWGTIELFGHKGALAYVEGNESWGHAATVYFTEIK